MEAAGKTKFILNNGERLNKEGKSSFHFVRLSTNSWAHVQRRTNSCGVMIAAVPSVLVQRCLNIKAHRSGVYFSSLSFFNTSCFPSCPMAPNSTEVMWGPGLIGEHFSGSPYLAADSMTRIHYSYSVWISLTQSLSDIDLQICKGSMGYLLGSTYSTCDLFRKIRKDSNYSWAQIFTLMKTSATTSFCHQIMTVL